MDSLYPNANEFSQDKYSKTKEDSTAYSHPHAKPRIASPALDRSPIYGDF
jgi:hypothetical protein